MDISLEIVVAIVAGSSVGVAIFGAWTTKIHQKMHRQYMSNQIMIEMVKISSEFRETIDSVLDNDDNVDKKELERLLNHLEDLGMFWHDGIVSFDQIRNMYGGLLRKIKGDNLLERTYKDKLESNPRLYEHIKKMLELLE